MSKPIIFLAQTDTTAGFLSSDYKILNKIKSRPLEQKILREMSDFNTLKSFYRLPNNHKNLIRRANKTSFVLPNKQSFRVVKHKQHLAFLRHFKSLYSTSANINKQAFDKQWALSKCDIVVLDSRGLSEQKPSRILKLGKKRIKKLRS